MEMREQTKLSGRRKPHLSNGRGAFLKKEAGFVFPNKEDFHRKEILNSFPEATENFILLMNKD